MTLPTFENQGSGCYPWLAVHGTFAEELGITNDRGLASVQQQTRPSLADAIDRVKIKP